ncbi:MAG: hypothetical protein DRQ54_07440, partial [Gammaproteobacteria bacterium]
PINDAEPPPALRDEVNAICGERFRRIDRFIQLCLLGAARCAQGNDLDNHTGLYIGSRFAAICNTIQVQQQMFVQGQLPKPAQFINTLSNSAGYYVARNLNLQGKNIFVSRGNASLEAALQLAQLDLESGQIKQALIGVVDEGVQPTVQHCQRLGIAATTPLGEGSHWFLVRLGANESRGKLGIRPRGNPGLATIHAVATLADDSSLQEWLSHYALLHRRTFIYSNSLSKKLDDSLYSGLAAYNPHLDYYPANTGGALLRFIKQYTDASLITLSTDDAGRTHVTYSQTA